MHGKGVLLNPRGEKKEGHWFKGTYLHKWEGYEDEEVE